ncbi:hypothetical protein BH24ACI3_BH24ACI3_14130 [soil metagenome]
MSGSATAEVYFITAMMILILIISGVAVFFFAKTYRKEMADKKKREGVKADKTSAAAAVNLGDTDGEKTNA